MILLGEKLYAFVCLMITDITEYIFVPKPTPRDKAIQLKQRQVRNLYSTLYMEMDGVGVFPTVCA